MRLEVATRYNLNLHLEVDANFGMNLQQTEGGSCNKLRMEVATIYELRLEFVTKTCGWRLQ